MSRLFDPGGPASTLLVPLWCRARCALEYPSLGVGEEDARLLRALRGDFSAARGSDCLLYALREKLMLAAAGRFLAGRPDAALVDLGCGLDTLLRRVPGTGERVYVDLPEVMELRARLLPPEPGERYIAADLRAPEPLGGIGRAGGFVIMAGLLCHLPDGAGAALLASLAGAFPGGGAAFDGIFAAARGGMPLSRLPGRAALVREGYFASLTRAKKLPRGFEAVPAAERLKLSALLNTGALRFYEARMA